MLRKIIPLFIMAFMPIAVNAQNTEEDTTLKALLESRAVSPTSPTNEMQLALQHLQTIPSQQRPFIRYFTTYAVPDNLYRDTALVLSFACHSLVGIPNDIDAVTGGYYPIAMLDENGMFVPKQLVEGTTDLWWIDIRDYGWTPTSWERMSVLDGYFAEPAVRLDVSASIKTLAGNAVIRADWFIHHALNTSAQDDYDIGYTVYETLLYAGREGGPPTTLEEWNEYWGFNEAKSKQLGNEYFTIVTKSRAVTRHNRVIKGNRTELGYRYQTYDPKNERGLRNYLDSFFLNQNIGQEPEVFEAGEAFATNALGMQVYALYLNEGGGKLINFGDPTLVRHVNDVYGDSRVRVAHSCIDCHSVGPLPAENTLKEAIEGGITTYIKDRDDYNRVVRNFLSGKFEESIKVNQEYFARALKHVNGMEASENGAAYLRVVQWYARDVDLKQAIRECGTTEQQLRESVSSIRYGMRLQQLLAVGETISREVWESPTVDDVPGAYQQAMMALQGLNVFTPNTVTNNTVVTDPSVKVVDNKVFMRVTQKCAAKKGDTVVKQFSDGDVVQVLPEENTVHKGISWTAVSINGETAFINSENLESIK